MSSPNDAFPAEPEGTEPSAADGTGAAAVVLAEDTPLAEDLSPAVRRLVRQFELDITGIHGTGPSGRIRVSDVIGMLGGRTDSGHRDAAPRPSSEPFEEDAERPADDSVRDPAQPLAAAGAAPAGALTTTVFDCDMTRILAHRKKLRGDNVETLLTSYLLTAFAEALRATPELTAGGRQTLGVSISGAEGQPRTALIDLLPSEGDAVLAQRVRSIDAALRATIDSPVDGAGLLVHHYGESGSVLATPTPIAPEHSASVGIGRVRREVAVRVVDGVETPRVTARCYVSLSFRAERIELHRANQFLARAVRVLEQWPE
jgi:pyruvate/2-oxoglutarate dehydrogenase complex dihydrolipoamide acyltransferase (E2) component